MPASTLSQRLIADGLPQGERHLILVACDEGIGSSEEFAKSLFTELRFRGHRAIVYYYFGVKVSTPVVIEGEAHKYAKSLINTISRANQHLWRLVE